MEVGCGVKINTNSKSLEEFTKKIDDLRVVLENEGNSIRKIKKIIIDSIPNP